MTDMADRKSLADELDRLADCEGGIKGGSERAAETMRQAAKHLRAQPPSREDAQPDTDCVSLLADLDAGKPVGREAAATIRSLIAERPARDALREAAEALEKALRSHRASLYPSEFAYVRQALATLQAEQGAKR